MIGEKAEGREALNLMDQIFGNVFFCMSIAILVIPLLLTPFILIMLIKNIKLLRFMKEEVY